MRLKHLQTRVNTPNISNNVENSSPKEIYQILMQELQLIVTKLLPGFLPPTTSVIQSTASDENKFIAFESYETQLEFQRNGSKNEMPLKLNEQSLDYNYYNLHIINQKNIQILSEFKQSMQQSQDPKQKAEYLEEYLKGLTRHCVYLSLEEKEAKTSKNFKFDKSEFQQIIFSVFYELFLLSRERNDVYSTTKFAEAFLVNHFWRENKICHEYALISFHYIQNILIDLYFENAKSIARAQASIAENLVGIAKKSYDYLVEYQENSAEMMTEFAIFQAIYLYHYELTSDKKGNLNIKRSAIISGEEQFESSFKLKDTHLYDGKNIKKYLLNNSKVLAMLKQAFRHCKRSTDTSSTNTIKTQTLLIIEFFVKTVNDVFSSVYQSVDLKYDEKRAYYNSIKANTYILKEMFSFAKSQNINCFHDDSFTANIKSLEKYTHAFITNSDKEFEKEDTKAKLVKNSLLQEKKPKHKKKSKKTNTANSDKTEAPAQEKMDQGTKSTLQIGPSKKSLEPTNDKNSIRKSLTHDSQSLYKDALLLLIKRDYVQALKQFDIIKTSTKRKELDLKIKAIVSMAECHIEMAKTTLKKKPLSYCFNHKKPISAEVRNEIIETIDQIKKALDCCDEAKRLTPKLPIEDRALFFGCIELVSLSALSVAEDLEKERNSYLKNMTYLKAILIKKGQYGQGVNTDPHHITARGVEWCSNCEMAILNITELANDFKQNVEISYNDETTKLEETVSGKTEKNEELFSNLKQNLQKMATTSADIKEHELKELEELQELLIKLENPFAHNQHLLFSDKNKDKTTEGSTPTPTPTPEF